MATYKVTFMRPGMDKSKKAARIVITVKDIDDTDGRPSEWTMEVTNKSRELLAYALDSLPAEWRAESVVRE